jgi:glyoxylase-like metal-dependent hydrolase (beta-lactamase superfamily II)
LTEVRRVVAPNPGPYTGPGTNTWILDAGPVVVVIDPGPDDDAHLDAINRKLAAATIGVVLVTHSHADHLPLSERLAAPHHAAVRRYPELGDRDVVRAGNLSITALHTPGHTADHLSFWLEGDRVVFTGDLVLGRGSSMVTYPEGDVAAYLRSLERLEALNPRLLFPGHWDPVTDAMEKLEEYRLHRLEREAQVLGEVRRGAGTAAELTRRVYGTELGDELLAAAEMTTRAHLKKLVDDGAVRVRTVRDEEVYGPTGIVGA